jgi:hypothetical protein
MSAVRAARALLWHDADLAAFAASIPAPHSPRHREIVTYYVRNYVMNTWTLTLAAEAAGETEEQVIAALLHLEPLRIGTTCICRGEAKLMFA